MTSPDQQDPDFQQIPSNQKLIRSSAINLTGRILTLLTSVALTPFTIRILGPQSYGTWSLLQSIATALTLADLGMSNTSTKLAAESYAHGKTQDEVSYTWSATLIAASFTIFVGAFVIFYSRDLLSFLGVSNHLISIASLALLFLTLSVLFIATINSLNTPQVVRLNWLSVAVVTYCPLILTVSLTPLLLVLIEHSIIIPSVISAGTEFLAALICVYFSYRAQPALFRIKFKKHVFKNLAYYGTTLTLTNIIVVFLSNGERFFLSHNHGTTALAYYSVAMSVAQVLLVLPLALVQPLLSQLTQLAAKNKVESIVNTYSKTLFILYTLVVPSLIVVAYLARPILQIWAGSPYQENSYYPLVVLLVGVFFSGIAHILYNHFLATGKPTTILKLHTIELLPYLLLAYFLTKHFGALGAALSWTLRASINSIVLQILVRVDNIKFHILPKHNFRSLILQGGLLIYVVGLNPICRSLPIRLLTLTVALPIYVAALWFYVLVPAERELLKNMATRLLPSSRN